MIPISVIIPVKNEEINLPRCIQPLKEFTSINVIDSGSTDRTKEIAIELGANFYNFQWNGKFPKKRNWALRNISFSTDWVLFLDADEYVTEEFKKEVNSAIQNKDINGYWLNFNNFFQGRLMKHGVPFKKLALFRIGKGEYEKIEEDHWSHLDMEIHEHPIISGLVGEIEAPITHYGYKGMYHYLAKHNEYSSWEARRFLQLRQNPTSEFFGNLTPRQQRKYSSLDKWWWAPVYFFTNYIFKRGFLDGRQGLVFSLLKLVYFFEIRCKIKEINLNQADVQ